MRRASIQLVSWKLMEKYNIDPAVVFEKCNLNPSLMYEESGQYPLNKIVALWDEMARAIPDPCFGLYANEHWHPSQFGPLGYVLLMSPNLRSTLQRLNRYPKVVFDRNFGRLKEDTDRGVVEFIFEEEAELVNRIAREDAKMSWLISILQFNYPDKLIPVSVNFTHDNEEYAEIYEKYFNVAVSFNSKKHSVELAIDDVDRTLPQHTESITEINNDILGKYIESPGDSSLARRVVTIIVKKLPEAHADIDTVAGELSMTRRSLQRQLKKEQETFTNLLHTTRRDIAIKYLKNSNLNINEIAYLLGFSDQSAFSRSFKKWTGESPEYYRTKNKLTQGHES